ncbi:hypothetical protein BJV85_001679 [Clostridium acetobutylicum]|uniref:Uncharacterized conserved protein n=1 Tax=Clostridium acetobutylicum (strain ATCC 824 / DSM 792 / JCM 1419 / IAM 19013 / LMG 5710 / NBRC 13948 / NRRL B-527 / VKM B-1787 / 2291 / W) TaxID=272562 RepID=Q97H12_CLOAB|nr:MULTISPECIES: motility associated factor glycosyltransferase family protein [Clostridium]AAK80159.1 Uncharacterized conserved protein [Clostridium acetobutylicum ATCC 824]ADZ21253.1 Conserved hypothetical protein [Clostridium acetobutylicum EA 2018]AEI32230.1 hypothetical protein SMB_G2235 [Clostridium acetobutylicum DSM 1731]AWV79415.1 DUF115 domain-containing protein [Clostridium acetobutylicum]MBC2394613.1 motility associated factor glycosyltransferase family protein [Clostridium acetobu
MNNITQITLNSLDNKEEQYCIEKSTDNKNIIKVEKNKKNIYLGSKYNVKKDIDKFLNEMGDYNKESIFVCFGLGAGEHIKELLKITENNIIVVIEQDNKVINTLVKNKVNLEVLQSDRVILSNFSANDIKALFQLLIPKEEVNNTNFAFYANYKRVYENEALETLKVYTTFLRNALIEVNTLMVHSQHFYKSFMGNLKYILDSVAVNKLKSNYNKDMPVVVVSAGPSLEKNIRFLKDCQDKCIIITGGRTLKTLLDLDIKPDYVCVVDPDVPAYDVMRGTFDCTAPLLFCEYTYYEILRDYKGEKIFFNDIGMLGLQKEFLNYDVDNIFEGGSVAHVCAGLGVYIGGDPIIFIGQDLAYTNDKAHADSAGDTNVEGDKKIVYVEDINGDIIKSDSVLNFYRIKLEEMTQLFKENNFINSTEGGANIKGTKIIPLKEVLKKFCLNKKKDYTLGENIGKYVSREQVVCKLMDAKKIMNKVKKEIEASIDLCSEFLEKENRWNKTIIDNINRKLSKTDKLINSSIGEMEFMRNLILPNIYESSMNKEYKQKYNETEKEKIKRVYKKNILLYNGIKTSIMEAGPEIEKCIKSLKES